MPTIDYLRRIADRSDLGGDEYHKALIDALEAWQLDLRHEKQDRVRNLERLLPELGFAAQEDVRLTLGILKEDLGVGR